MTYVPGVMEKDGIRFHCATQNGTQLKTYDLFISRKNKYFHVVNKNISMKYFQTVVGCGKLKP